MKQQGKKSFTLHPRFRKLGANGGSMRWHIEEFDVDERTPVVGKRDNPIGYFNHDLKTAREE